MLKRTKKNKNNTDILLRKSPCVIANMLDCNIIVSMFKHQLVCYVHFQTNILGERHELLYPSSYGLNNTTIILLQRWLALNNP